MKVQDKIRTCEYPDGSIQRIQTVTLNTWEEPDFFSPEPSPKAFAAFVDIYQRFLVPAAPFLFGHMVMFHIENISTDFADLYQRTCAERFGRVTDPLCQLTVLFREHVRIKKEGVCFSDKEVKKIYERLSAGGALQVVSGQKNSTHIIPLGLQTGCLSETEEKAQIKANSSFFIMDRFDLASVYDSVGTPIGLMVKNGVILNPPLYKREALLVRKDGRIEIAVPSLEALGILIRGITFQHAKNCLIYTRPKYACTPVPTKGEAIDLVIIGRQIQAVHRVHKETVRAGNKIKRKSDNRTEIPASGFVLRVFDEYNEAEDGGVGGGSAFEPGDEVSYTGLENVLFGLQVGNSILRNGRVTRGFISPFYNIKKPWQTPFPPSLYPLDFENARAARMALGADREGRPILLWAEGAGKVFYEKGKDSRGATLKELGTYCREAGMIQAVNLDGGGSAQILINNRRHLKISDRNAADNTEQERAVPCGLIVR